MLAPSELAVGPSYCAQVCDSLGRCAAEGNEEWEDGCLREPVSPLPANSFIWYAFSLCMTQWEYAQFDGSKIALKYETIFTVIREGGFEGRDFLDQVERLNVLEAEILKNDAEARRIKKGVEAEREEFQKSLADP